MKTTVKSILFPCLLSFTAIMSILYIYETPEMFPITSCIVFAANFLLFVLYEKLRVFNKKLLSTVIIMVLVIVSGFIAIELIRMHGWRAMSNFTNWFFRTEEDPRHYVGFVAALMVFFTPFLSMAMFYYSIVKYNSFFLMLTCMITFALYAKTYTEIPFMFPSIIIAVFLFISIEKRWYKEQAENALNYFKFIAIGACFVIASAYVAGLFPQARTTPYREQFDEFISGQSIALINTANIIMDSNESASAPVNTDTEILLYRVKADEPVYLRRQVFDNWNGQGWEHYEDDTAWWNHIFENSSVKTAPAYEWRSFFEQLRQNETILDELDFWNQAPPVRRSTMEITVLVNSRTYFIPTPGYPAQINYSEEVRRSIRDEFFTEWTTRYEHTYSVEYYSDYVSGDFLSQLTPERVELLEQTGMYFYMYDTFIYHERYQEYMDSCLELPDYPNSDRVRELALSLTEDYESDYEKAKAIEQYFYNGEFVYDLGFAPESKAVDYFLFESKRGTCSDFASAMTVLAREAGLYARYVEGYVMREMDENGDFLIKIKHAHAFPEIFIGGWGWVIFEPTIPDTGTENNTYYTVLALLITTGVLFASGMLFMLFGMPHVLERRFRRRALRAAPNMQVTMLYNKIYGFYMKQHRISQRTLSSCDLVKLSETQFGVSLSPLTENYDRITYGGINAEKEDYCGIYAQFTQAVKERSKNGKSNKRNTSDELPCSADSNAD
ncbi:MAG: transglutaminaseTgpA domain-containing protein [Oscillospiraceae bacterium]|nr:transglutaminaseTgpA domain-containing protein [Oscillospiraceae bacterium]